MKWMLLLILLATAIGSAVLCQTDAPNADGPAYRKRITEWRKEQEADLKKENGWLSVAGLFWLAEGENSLGTNSAAKVRLPAGSAPTDAGNLTLEKSHVTLHLAEGVKATCQGKPITTMEMRSDTSGMPDQVTIGALTLTVIQRGKRIGIRLYDNDSHARRKFTGQRWFPVEPAYRITAQFIPYDPPRKVAITNVLGDTQDMPNPGYVVFTIQGKRCRLEAQSAGDGLFFNFRDGTSGKTTYPAGRFLDAPKPVGGKVILDFNQAVNPPCAFTEFATCPLPPQANHLSVSIPAGEQHDKVTR